MAEHVPADNGGFTPDVHNEYEPSGYPVRMGMEEGLAYIERLQGGLSLLGTETPEPDAEQAANERAFVQNLNVYGMLLVRQLAGYDDVAIPSGPEFAEHVKALQDLFGQGSELRGQPQSSGVGQGVSRQGLVAALDGCYAEQAHAFHTGDEIQRCAAGATLQVWSDMVQANPDGILLDARANAWMHELDVRCKQAFGSEQGE